MKIGNHEFSYIRYHDHDITLTEVSNYDDKLIFQLMLN